MNVDIKSIESNISGNSYTASQKYPFSNHDGSMLLLDDHSSILEPKGFRFITFLWTTSVFSTYYYYYTLFNKLYFGLSAGLASLITIILIHSSMKLNFLVGEICLLPDKKNVSILMMSGQKYIINIKTITYKRQTSNIIEMSFMFRDRELPMHLYKNNKSHYVNNELLSAIGHPEVH